MTCSAHEPSTLYGVVIATNLYAGNFERQLTAYCTGRVGECEVGDHLITLFMEDLNLEEQDVEEDPFWDAIPWIPDDRGCARPCSIHRNKNNKYEDVIIYFNECPTQHQVDIIRSRAQQYAGDERIKTLSKFDEQPKLQILNVSVIRIRTVVEDVKRDSLPTTRD